MRRMQAAGLALAALLFAPLAASAQNKGEPGQFDHYVLALSWSPSYCEAMGARAEPAQCATARPFAFVVHGLWPQYRRGWPENCVAPAPFLPEPLLRSMLDVMPSRRLVLHQWRKHGTCDGTDSAAYFATVRRAYERVTIPEAFRRLDDYRMVAPGEVLRLVGGNGAGKSTLMRILCGVTRADAGSITLRGIDIATDLYDTALAQAGGIRIVHQELSLCDNLSVAENFFLEAPEAARALPGWRRIFRARARAALDEVFPDHGISVDARVAHLEIGQRQMVEIARAVATPQVRLVILDEPTSSLGLERSRQLRAYIKARTAQGLAFIFISHKLQEVVDIAHRVLVLRNGRSVWCGPAVEASVEALVRAMGGASESEMRSRRAGRPVIGAEAPEQVRPSGSLVAALGRDVVLRAGEVVGLAGLEGSGQRDLLHRLHRRPGAGIVRKGNASFVSGDRQKEGVFPLWSVLSNIALGRPDASDDEIRTAAAAARADDFVEALPEGYDTVVGERGSQLSGGERQRLAIARAILKDAPILVLDEATSALDVETEGMVKQAIDDLSSDRTTFIIAHRLSTVRSADLVLFMDKGHLVESGSFDELAARGGRFTDLLRAGGLKLEDKATKVIEGSNVMPFPTKGAVG
ncbi:MAG: ATP-binding cassette domain-containing protein [Starkeya sp.]|nr:ATP-binding cassette domain-containing protein [Starkeya sp.]